MLKKWWLKTERARLCDVLLNLCDESYLSSVHSSFLSPGSGLDSQEPGGVRARFSSVPSLLPPFLFLLTLSAPLWLSLHGAHLPGWTVFI